MITMQLDIDSSRVDSAIKRIKEALSNLEGSGNKHLADGMRNFESEIQTVIKSLDKLQSTLLGTKSVPIKVDSEQAEASIKKVKKSLDGVANTKTDRASKAIDQITKSAKSASTATQDLGSKVKNMIPPKMQSGVDGVSDGLNKITQSIPALGSISSGFSSIISAAGAVASVAIAIGQYKKAVAVGAEYSNTIAGAMVKMEGSIVALAERSGVSIGYVEEKLDGLVRGLASTSQYSASEVAGVLDGLALAGQSAEQAMDTLPAVLDSAAASGTDLATVTSVMTSALASFNLDASQASNVSDVLVYASNNAKVSVAGLGESLKAVGAVSNSLGVSLEETTAVLSVLGDKGIDGSQAGTALKSALQGLAGTTSKSAQALAQLGIDTKDANGEFKDLGVIATELNEKTANMSGPAKLAIATQIAGQTGSSALLALMDDAESINERIGKLSNDALGYANDTAKKLNQTTKALLGGLSSSIEELYISMFKSGESGFRSLIVVVTETVDNFKWLGDILGMVISVLASFGSVILKNINSALKPFQQIWDALKPSIQMIIDAFDEYCQILNQNQDEMDAFVANILSYVMPVFDVLASIIATIVGLFVELIKLIKDKLNKALDESREKAGKWGEIWDNIKEKLNEFKDKLSIFAIFIRKLPNHFSEIWELIKADMENWPADFQRTMARLEGAFRIWLASLPVVAKHGLKLLWDQMISFWSNLGQTVKELLMAPFTGDDIATIAQKGFTRAFERTKKNLSTFASAVEKELAPTIAEINKQTENKVNSILLPNQKARDELKNKFKDLWQEAEREYYDQLIKAEGDHQQAMEATEQAMANLGSKTSELAKDFGNLHEPLEKFFSQAQEGIDYLWEGFERLSVATKDIHGLLSDINQGFAKAGQDITSLISGIATLSQEREKEKDNILAGAQQIANGRQEEAQRIQSQALAIEKETGKSFNQVLQSMGLTMQELEQELHLTMENILEENGVSLEDLEEQAKVTAQEIATVVTGVMHSIAGVASAITQSVFKDMQSKLDQQHQKELAQLKEKEEAWKEYWKTLEEASKETNDAMYDHLREQFSMGLLTEQEYREAVDALKEEEDGKQKERDDQKKAEEDALEEEKKALEAKQKEEKNALDKKAFDAQKANAIAQIAISSAMGVVAAWANPITAPFMIPLIIGAGIAETAIVASQKFVPKYAKGTRYHEGGMALVGEAGAELINLPKGSEVISAGRTKNMLDGNKESIVININAPIYGVNDLEKVIMNILDQREETLSSNYGYGG